MSGKKKQKGPGRLLRGDVSPDAALAADLARIDLESSSGSSASGTPAKGGRRSERLGANAKKKKKKKKKKGSSLETIEARVWKHLRSRQLRVPRKWSIGSDGDVDMHSGA
ncbi:hypothetical protein DRE_03305 [Drechslerella stenobrocha 248]|uniref:Uncharacterized protein n=1 Tax=Drechslerella stenobrocha 248 TaxID=1043628 RepID=W7IF41_9PEZI|nr:hypothetical protein DRE_03305 [Drechslerella stenobrocha 248]